MGKKKKGGHKGDRVSNIITLATAILLLIQAVVEPITRCWSRTRGPKAPPVYRILFFLSVIKICIKRREGLNVKEFTILLDVLAIGLSIASITLILRR